MGSEMCIRDRNGAAISTDGIRAIVPSAAITATDEIEPVPQLKNLSQPTSAAAEIDLTVASEPPPAGNDFSKQDEANLEKKRSPLHQIDALPATTAAYDSGERSLQAPEEETWVLPAVVKVKD